MASPSSPPPLLIRLFLILSLLSLAAAARPCKTLLISSISIVNRRPIYPSNPTLFFRNSRFSPSGFVTIFTEITEIEPVKPSSSEVAFDRRFFPGHHPERVLSRPALPLGLSSSYDFSSLRERTKDILSVVVALLFGVGCGALTAATMYLAWSIFFSRYEYRTSFEEYSDEEGDYEADASPKKMGYEKIPAAATPVKEVA